MNMTPFEELLLRYLELREVASWADLRGQFVVSEGYLTVAMNSLKRHLYVQQDGLYYRATNVGRAALAPKERRRPFEGRAPL